MTEVMTAHRAILWALCQRLVGGGLLFGGWVLIQTFVSKICPLRKCPTPSLPTLMAELLVNIVPLQMPNPMHLLLSLWHGLHLTSCQIQPLPHSLSYTYMRLRKDAWTCEQMHTYQNKHTSRTLAPSFIWLRSVLFTRVVKSFTPVYRKSFCTRLYVNVYDSLYKL